MLSVLNNTNFEVIKQIFAEKTYDFNISIEDNNALFKLANINQSDNIFIKTLGGCNVLNLLLYNPNCICSYDTNIFHNFLLELKIACIKCLEYEQYYDIFINMNRQYFDRYKDFIFLHMQTDEARKFITDNINMFDNFLYSGKSSIQYVINVIFDILKTKYPEFKQQLDNSYHKNINIDHKLIRKIITNDKDMVISYVMKGIKMSSCILSDEYLNILNNITEDYINERIMTIYNNPDILNNNMIIYAYLYGQYSNKKLQPYIANKKNFNIIKQNITKIYIFDGKFDIVSSQLKGFNINKIFLIDDIFDYYDINIIVSNIKKNLNNNTIIYWKDKLSYYNQHINLQYIYNFIINSNNYFKAGLPCDNLPVNKYIKVAKII